MALRVHGLKSNTCINTAKCAKCWPPGLMLGSYRGPKRASGRLSRTFRIQEGSAFRRAPWFIVFFPRGFSSKFLGGEDEDEVDWPGAGGRLQAPTRGQYTLGVGGSRGRSPRPQSPRPSRGPKHSRGRARGRSAFWANTFRYSRINLQPTAQPGHRQARGGRGSQAP